MTRERKIPLSLFALALLPLVTTGCGTLKHCEPTSFSGLSQNAVAFIDEQPRSDVSYTFAVGRERLHASKGASYFVPAIPFFYLKTLGKDYDDYYLARYLWVLPIWGSAKVGVFDKNGRPTEIHTQNGLQVLVDLASLSTHKKGLQSASPESSFAVRVLYGLLGFGTDYFQILWIPIASPE